MGGADQDNDNIQSSTEQLVVGQSGDDKLRSSNGDTLLLGGLGNDTLEGSSADDTYVYRFGDGNDSIYDNSIWSSDDRLVIADVTSDEATFSGNGDHATINFDNGEKITLRYYLDLSLRYNIETIQFADGTLWNEEQFRARMLEDMKVEGSVVGTERAETYFHSIGDGSYSVKDYDYLVNDSTDRFVFLTATSEEVVFGQASGKDLTLSLSNGEIITIDRHFDTDGDYAIEIISFADGVDLDAQDIRDRSVDDMKSTGSVLGSELRENYVHRAGDGNYLIRDYDYLVNDADDTLAFSDLSSGEVRFTQVSGNDLKLTTSAGDEITIDKHFDSDEDYAIEIIRFADGVVLDAQAIRDRSIADMKVTGSVLGSELQENYVHAVGDGSYVIRDYDYLVNDADDQLEFIGLASSDVVFSQGSSNDLQLTLANGEQITIDNHFDSDGDFTIESIRFSDGETLDAQGIRNRSVEDMKSTGLVLGTELTEIYAHKLGDGSYTIADYDYLVNDGYDEFIFEDLDSSQVGLSHGASESLILTVGNSDVITIENHFRRDGDYALEGITFADGITLDLQDIRDRTASDMKSVGLVVGSELVENYYHASGDGSYTIKDYDYLRDGGSDVLIFTDIASTDASFSASQDDNLIIDLADGDRVTIERYFENGRYYVIEEITFSDSVSFGVEEIDALVVA